MDMAVATSIYKNNNFDPFETIKYAVENKIPAIQFFMDKKLQDDLQKIENIRDLCQKSLIKILCHSSQEIGNVSHDTAHCKALSSIFLPETNKYCIFHFSEEADVYSMISDCEKLVNFGLIPCIENFYKERTLDSLKVNMKKYLSFFDIAFEKDIPVIPVLDFPRLFVEKFIDFNPVSLSKLLIQKFAKRKIIIHAIDSKLPRQDRDDWCAVGNEKGIVSWTDIFEYIKNQDVSIEYTVLEYENRLFINESIQNLEKFMP